MDGHVTQKMKELVLCLVYTVNDEQNNSIDDDNNNNNNDNNR